MTTPAVKSAQRVFEILEYFDRARRPLSLKDICDQLSYPVSSGAMVLKSLVVLGYLQYDRASRTYLPTMRIAVLGNWVPRTLFGGMNILPLMEAMRDETGATIVLGAQSDLYAHYVHVEHAQEPLHYAPSPGTIRPLARSGIGQLLLSGLPRRDVELLVRRINIADPDHRIDADALADDLATIRRQGFVFSRSLFAQGVGMVAVLLPQAPFGRRFALGLAGPVEELDRDLDDHLRRLRAATETMA